MTTISGSFENFFSAFKDSLEATIKICVEKITDNIPVKVIRDDKGVPFLYRYHILSLSDNGPGLCFHRFVKSDPDRGYHDHPWERSVSFILCGKYDERVLARDKTTFEERTFNRWSFNHLDGIKTFHRVMIEEGEEVWTIFAFGSRSKTWGMKGLDGTFKQMSKTIKDTDGGWWRTASKGLNLSEHLPNIGNVISTVDVIICKRESNSVLLIKRGKNPFKGSWALPGGRIEEHDKTILSAAKRELFEETNIKDIDLKYFKTIGNNTRDPRGFCLTNIFYGYLLDHDEPEEETSDRYDTITKKQARNCIRAGDDAVDYAWFNVGNLPELAFDHAEIISSFLEK